MFFKRILPISIILIAGLTGLWLYQNPNPCVGNIDSTYQNGWQGIFAVKVERKPETCGFVAGAYYTFSSKQSNSENWQEIMTFRHDDPVEISKESIHIVNEKTAFVFMGWMAAITSDAGETWNIWNAEKDITSWKGVNYGLIEDMNVSENAEGVMILDPIPDRNEPNELYTSDFGKTWKQTK